MPRRNFILLIIALGIVVIGILGYLYYRQTQGPNDTGSFGTNFLSIFNPFQVEIMGVMIVEAENQGENNEGEEDTIEINSKLRKVSSMPIAGFTFFNKERLKEIPIPSEPTEGTQEEGDTTKQILLKISSNPSAPPTELAEALRYVERSTGNIYQTFVDKIEERRFSLNIIPKVYDAYFGNNAQAVVMRYIKLETTNVIETFKGILPKEILGEDISSNSLNGNFLIDEIKDISLSPDNSKIFYINTVDNLTTGTIMNLADGKRNQVFNSDFSEWLSFWPTSKTITLTTKPSSGVAGHMYTFDVDKKNMNLILSDIYGLTTLMSPNGKYILVGNSNVSLFLYNISTKTFTNLGLNTLPEKCTWNKTSEVVYCSVPVFIDKSFIYPDDWYKGEVSFSDQIWGVDIGTLTTSMLVDPVEEIGGEEIDGIKLMVDNKDDYLFCKQKDSFLWQLGLK